MRPVAVSAVIGHSVPARHADAAPISQEGYTHALPGELDQAKTQFEHLLIEAEKASDTCATRKS